MHLLIENMMMYVLYVPDDEDPEHVQSQVFIGNIPPDTNEVRSETSRTLEGFSGLRCIILVVQKLYHRS